MRDQLKAAMITRSHHRTVAAHPATGILTGLKAAFIPTGGALATSLGAGSEGTVGEALQVFIWRMKTGDAEESGDWNFFWLAGEGVYGYSLLVVAEVYVKLL